MASSANEIYNSFASYWKKTQNVPNHRPLTQRWNRLHEPFFKISISHEIFGRICCYIRKSTACQIYSSTVLINRTYGSRNRSQGSTGVEAFKQLGNTRNFFRMINSRFERKRIRYRLEDESVWFWFLDIIETTKSQLDVYYDSNDHLYQMRDTFIN